MRIHTYLSSSGKDLVSDYILSLPEEEKADGLSVLEAMEQDKMETLILKRWEGKVWEACFRKHNRIFYIAVDGRDVYLLHACRKQKNKTEKRDRNIVIKRAKELGRELGKKFL